MPTSTFGQRLRDALDLRGMGYRGLAKRLQERRLKRGYTPRAVAYYLADEVTPSTQWIEAAADVLEVSAAFLALNEGPMVPPPVPESDASDTHSAGKPTQAEVLECSLPPDLYATIKAHAEWVGGSFLGAWSAVVQSQPDKPPTELTREEYLAIGRLVALPALKIPEWIGQREEWEIRDLSTYLNVVWNGVLLAAPRPKQGRPLQELLDAAPSPWPTEPPNDDDGGENA